MTRITLLRRALLTGLIASVSLIASLLLLARPSAEEPGSHEAWLALAMSVLCGTGIIASHTAWLLITRRVETFPAALIAQRTRGITLMLIAATCLLPANWLAREHDVLLNLSSLTQVEPGEATQRAIQALPGKLHVTAFLPPASDLEPVLNAYFAPLEGVAFHVRDQRSSPDEARRLAVKDNGVLVLEYVSSPHPPAIKRIDTGVTRARARQFTTRLDTNIYKQLQGLTSEKRTIYVLQGDEELAISGQHAGGPASFEQGRAALEERLNLKVEPLGLMEGALDRVPDDAGALLVLGPLRPLSSSHIEVISAYMDRGGSVLIALEPGTPHAEFTPLFTRMLIRHDATPLATMAQALTLTRTRLDRYNILTRDIMNHPATSSFRDPRESLSLIFPSTGYLEEIAAPQDAARATFVQPLVGSPPSSWADVDRNYEYDATHETRARRILSLAAQPRPSQDGAAPWRAIVLADSTVFSDLVLQRSRGNEALLLDHVSWLLEDVSSPGPGVDDERTIAPLSGPERHTTLVILALGPLIFFLLAWGVRRRRWRA